MPLNAALDRCERSDAALRDERTKLVRNHYSFATSTGLSAALGASSSGAAATLTIA